MEAATTRTGLLKKAKGCITGIQHLYMSCGTSEMESWILSLYEASAGIDEGLESLSKVDIRCQDMRGVYMVGDFLRTDAVSSIKHLVLNIDHMRMIKHSRELDLFNYPISGPNHYSNSRQLSRYYACIARRLSAEFGIPNHSNLVAYRGKIRHRRGLGEHPSVPSPNCPSEAVGWDVYLRG